MMSPELASIWICRMPSCAAWHGFEAAMWRRTAARLRNRPWLDSLPVEVQWAQSKRVPRPGPSPSGPWTAGTEAMTAAASKSICPTDIIAYRANCTVFVGMHERPRVLLLSVLRCTLPLPRTLWHLPGTAPRLGKIELKCNVTALAIPATLWERMELWRVLHRLL
jgi:hypothetical protein